MSKTRKQFSKEFKAKVAFEALKGASPQSFWPKDLLKNFNVQSSISSIFLQVFRLKNLNVLHPCSNAIHGFNEI